MLRIAFFSASLRCFAFKHEIDGHRPVERHIGAVDDLADARLGDEVPQPSSENTIVSITICDLRYSLGFFLFAHLALPRNSHAASVRPKYDGK